MERIRNIIKVDHKKNAQLPKGVAGIPTPKKIKKINCYPETMAKLHLAEHNAAIEAESRRNKPKFTTIVP